MLLRFSLLLSLAAAAFAGTVVDVNGPIFGSSGAAGLSVAWSTSSPLHNVQIAATLVNGGGAPQYGIGTAWLTTALGPGTTLAQVIAESAIQTSCLCDEQVVLFSGLDLAAGDYFVTIGAPAPPVSYLNWDVTHSPTVQAGAGITWNGWRALSDPYGAFPPASSVTLNFPGDSPVQYMFSVSSSVPEPGGVWLAALGMCAIAAKLGRRRARV